MATKSTYKTERADEYAYPRMLPKPPPRPYSMQQEPIASEIREVIRCYFSGRPDVFVSGEGYVCHDTRDRSGWLVPDLVVAFGVDPPSIHDRNGYVISEVGKPPDFVLEIASESTGVEDYTRKREGYARFGVREYWRFDRSGGDYHDLPLAGDTLIDGEYQPISLRHEPDGLIRGHSPVLGLDLCWDGGRLRFYDSETGEYLSNLSESEARADIEAKARADAEAEAQRLRERLRRLQR